MNHGIASASERGIGRCLALEERIRIARHAQFADRTGAQREPAARECIQHLVRQEHSSYGALRDPLEPDDPPAQFPRQPLQSRPLALGEISTHLENGIALRQHARCRERFEHDGGHSTGSRAQLQNIPARLRQHFGALARHTAAEQVGNLRRGDEIASRADLDAARGVVAQTGGVEGELHESLERQPPAGGSDLPAQHPGDRPGVLLLVGRQRGQD